jgi:acetyltransferase EpsM
MSTEKSLVLIGGGEHACVVVEAAIMSVEEWKVLGYFDELECPEITKRFGVTRLGGDAALRNHSRIQAVLGFGALKSRENRARAVERLDNLVGGWGTVTHRAAFVSPTASVGPGTVIMASAVIQTGARVGSHCVINSGAIIEHDVVVEDFAQIAPGVTIGGGASVGREAYVGLGASIRDHVRVGSRSIVGMGAVVVRDVSAEATVRGVPAR